MVNAHITRLQNQMIDLRDNNSIDETINEELENLQDRLNSLCRVERVRGNITNEQHEQIMESVEW